MSQPNHRPALDAGSAVGDVLGVGDPAQVRPGRYATNSHLFL